MHLTLASRRCKSFRVYLSISLVFLFSCLDVLYLSVTVVTVAFKLFFFCYGILGSNLFSHGTQFVCEATWTWASLMGRWEGRGQELGLLLPFPPLPPASPEGPQEAEFCKGYFKKKKKPYEPLNKMSILFTLYYVQGWFLCDIKIAKPQLIFGISNPSQRIQAQIYLLLSVKQRIFSKNPQL